MGSNSTKEKEDKEEISGKEEIIKKQVQYAKLKLWNAQVKKFDRMRVRLAEEDEFNIWDGSTILVGCTSDGVIQAFICVIDTDSYLDVGRKEIKDENELKIDFEKRGGISGKKGGFITSLSGNIKEYYNLGKELMKNLNMITNGLEYLFLHVSERKATKDKLIRLYENNGFKPVQEKYIEDNESFIIMRKKYYKLITNIKK